MIFWIILGLIIWLAVKWFTRPIEIDGLTLIFAEKRTGKTTYLSKIVADDMKRKEPRYTQYLCNVPIYGTKKIDIRKELGKYEIIDSLTLCDEAHEELSNRFNLPEDIIKYLRYQGHFKSSHEAHNDIVLVSHTWEDLNINCRRVYDNMYHMEKSMFWSIVTRRDVTRIRKIKKHMGISEVENKPTDVYEYEPFLMGTVYFDRKPYYQYFDSLYRYEMEKKDFEYWDTDCEIKPTLKEKVIRFVQRIKTRKDDDNATKEKDTETEQADIPA